jgi:hypothetical protein
MRAIKINIQESSIKILLISVFALTSFACEPSFCDCNDNYGSLSVSQKEKCDKMIDRTSSAELRKKMQKCNNK